MLYILQETLFSKKEKVFHIKHCPLMKTDAILEKRASCCEGSVHLKVVKAPERSPKQKQRKSSHFRGHSTKNILRVNSVGGPQVPHYTPSLVASAALWSAGREGARGIQQPVRAVSDGGWKRSDPAFREKILSHGRSSHAKLTAKRAAMPAAEKKQTTHANSAKYILIINKNQQGVSYSGLLFL